MTTPTPLRPEELPGAEPLMEKSNMRRNYTLPFALSLLVLALSAPVASGQATGLKIGHINSAAIYDEAPGGQAAQQQFEQDMQRFRGEVQRLGDELQALIAQYEDQQMTLSPEARRAREAEIRERDGAYRERVAQLENEAGRRQQELVEPLMQRINDVIEAVRRDGNYSLIFDTGPGSYIVAADPALDLTNEVIRRLRGEGN